jgi:hypothetical protein
MINPFLGMVLVARVSEGGAVGAGVSAPRDLLMSRAQARWDGVLVLVA